MVIKHWLGHYSLSCISFPEQFYYRSMITAFFALHPDRLNPIMVGDILIRLQVTHFLVLPGGRTCSRRTFPGYDALIGQYTG